MSRYFDVVTPDSFEHLPPDDQEAVRTWIRDHGLQPDEVARISHDDDGRHLIVYEVDAEGLRYVGSLGEVAVRRVDATHPWPLAKTEGVA